MNGTTTTTAVKAREEISALDRALAKCANPRYLRWETLTAALESENFPYLLCQTARNDMGDITRHTNYFWRNRKWTEGALYINETEAGAHAFPGTQRAVDRLRAVLAAAL